jgi:hypothetical protein
MFRPKRPSSGACTFACLFSRVVHPYTGQCLHNIQCRYCVRRKLLEFVTCTTNIYNAVTNLHTLLLATTSIQPLTPQLSSLYSVTIPSVLCYLSNYLQGCISIYTHLHFSFQRITIEISRNNVSATRTNGSNGPDNGTDSGAPASVISPVIGDCVLNNHLLESSVVPGPLPQRSV